MRARDVGRPGGGAHLGDVGTGVGERLAGLHAEAGEGGRVAECADFCFRAACDFCCWRVFSLLTGVSFDLGNGLSRRLTQIPISDDRHVMKFVSCDAVCEGARRNA